MKIKNLELKIKNLWNRNYPEFRFHTHFKQNYNQFLIFNSPFLIK